MDLYYLTAKTVKGEDLLLCADCINKHHKYWKKKDSPDDIILTDEIYFGNRKEVYTTSEAFMREFVQAKKATDEEHSLDLQDYSVLVDIDGNYIDFLESSLFIRKVEI